MLGGQAPARPVRRIRGRGLEGLDHDRLDHVVADRGSRAGPGRVTSPSRRSVANRCRHLPTVVGLHPSAAAISACVRTPSAQANTIRQRNANACDEECRRAQRWAASPVPRRSR
jgi:hypothetical protein